MNLAAKLHPSKKVCKILLVDDDIDDCFFFRKAIHNLPIPTKLTTLTDSEKMMDYLLDPGEALPDLIFLDLNMPRKNGMECLQEIKQHAILKSILVIICSTGLPESGANEFFRQGAHYYIRKAVLPELKKILDQLLSQIVETKFARPGWSGFIFNLA
jgi:CheY-like chemotaxis protein